MNNKTLYETKTPTLADVIDGIGGGAKGATYLIPDLQRGFVWNPQKIEALLDTVIKGWPFGSVLLAEIGTQALARGEHGMLLLIAAVKSHQATNSSLTGSRGYKVY